MGTNNENSNAQLLSLDTIKTNLDARQKKLNLLETTIGKVNKELEEINEYLNKALKTLESGKSEYNEEQLKQLKANKGITSEGPNNALIDEILIALHKIIVEAESKQSELKANLDSLNNENQKLLKEKQRFINEMNTIKGTLETLVNNQEEGITEKGEKINEINKEEENLKNKIKDLETKLETTTAESSKAHKNAIMLTVGVSSLVLTLGLVVKN